jgi:hypothetical protein
MQRLREIIINLTEQVSQSVSQLQQRGQRQGTHAGFSVRGHRYCVALHLDTCDH